MIEIKNRWTGEVLKRVEADTLRGADLRGAALTLAALRGANLRGANLKYANLRGANLTDADLTGADLMRADLTGADLMRADLTDADLRGANLTRADLTGADLTGAIMSDGRTWEDYRADHLDGICKTPEVKAKAIAAWGKHSWQDCPMHCALGVSAPPDILVAAWVALYDANLLERPGTP